MASSTPKTSPLNSIILGVRISAYGFGGDKHWVHKGDPCLSLHVLWDTPSVWHLCQIFHFQTEYYDECSCWNKPCGPADASFWPQASMMLLSPSAWEAGSEQFSFNMGLKLKDHWRWRTSFAFNPFQSQDISPASEWWPPWSTSQAWVAGSTSSLWPPSGEGRSVLSYWSPLTDPVDGQLCCG